MSKTPTLLLILDGWGIAPEGDGNAVYLADTPVLDGLFKKWPNSSLLCSGRSVGLPDGFMGNSEVGHMNIGGGRIIYQDMTRIDRAIEDGSFFTNDVLTETIEKAKSGCGKLHYMGLLSDGGVHSHQLHLYALLKLAKEAGLEEVYIHCFMDGRDTSPTSGVGFVESLQAKIKEIGIGRIASLSGRYYAMDRDKHYERNAIAYDALVNGQGETGTDPVQVLKASYAADITDEFIKPTVMLDDSGAPLAKIESGDAVFFFNFRADRARQISRTLFDNELNGFDRTNKPELCAFATMTRYEESFPLAVAFPPQEYSNTLGETVSRSGMNQLRIAETEKYAHVTYFMNCGEEEPFPNEDRQLVASPRDVATYDLKPQMSVLEVTDILVNKLSEYDMVICNLANLDMVGHTGVIPAVEEAVKTVDSCVGRIVEKVLSLGGKMLMTADHGNAEQMIADDGSPHTAHSLNPVPLIYIDNAHKDAKLDTGILGDLAPTILGLLGLEQPAEMTGKNLIK
ncbi:MAG: 2,3-bisphosphoglycerate-independent phosphoglycerate mutase [Desulfovibrio sp.]